LFSNKKGQTMVSGTADALKVYGADSISENRVLLSVVPFFSVIGEFL